MDFAKLLQAGHLPLPLRLPLTPTLSPNPTLSPTLGTSTIPNPTPTPKLLQAGTWTTPNPNPNPNPSPNPGYNTNPVHPDSNQVAIVGGIIINRKSGGDFYQVSEGVRRAEMYRELHG